MKTKLYLMGAVALGVLAGCQTTEMTAAGAKAAAPAANFVAQCPHPHDKRDPWLAGVMSAGTTAEKLTADWSSDHLDDPVLAAAVSELSGAPFPGSEEKRLNNAQCWKRLQ